MSAVVRVERSALEAFARELLLRGGIDEAEARTVAAAIAWCDLVGRPTQGIWRLPSFVARVEAGAVRSPADARLERTGPGTAVLHGGAGLGYHLATVAADAAIELALESGVGAVGVRGSDHFGAGAYYANRIAAAGFVAIVTSNAFPKVAPTGGRSPVLGTNPLAVGFPLGERPVLIDFATAPLSGAAVRRGKLDPSVRARHLHVERPGDPPVQVRVDPKTFALGLAVEVLAGVLTGAGVSDELASTVSDLSRPSGLGHFVLALDPARFVGSEAFEERLGRLLERVRAALPLIDGEEVRVPGDARHAAREEAESHGIPLSLADLGEVEQLASRLGVGLPW